MTRILPLILLAAFGFAPAPANSDSWTVELPAARAAELGLLPETVSLDAARVGEAVGFELFWCLMNVPSDGLPVADVECYTINDSYGLYPRVKDGKVINGGTPIGMDLSLHTDKLAQDLTTLGMMARTDLDGALIALDYESWGPTLPPDGPYRKLALEQITARYPDLGPACIVAVAESEWKQRAARFFEASIDVAKATRPEIKWGFYYPQARTYWSGAYSGDFADERRAQNDLLAATWAKVQWFPVSVYFFYPSGEGKGYGSEQGNRQYIRDNVGEFVRLRGEDDRPVIAMIQPTIHHSNSVFKGQPIPDADLRLIAEEARAAGGDGLMVWGWISPRDADYAAKVAEIQAQAGRIARAWAEALTP